MDELSGKVAVITGGASGIGLATAKRLGTEDMKIVLADIEPEPLDRAVDELRALGVEAISVLTDVASRDAVVALADAAFEQFDRVHFLFNNAGVAVSGPIAEMTHEDWKRTIDVDLWGPIHGVEVFLPRMIDQHEGGHIASTASFAGVVPNDGLGVYCVAKYGVVAMSEVLWRPGVSGLRRSRRRGYGGRLVVCRRRSRACLDRDSREQALPLHPRRQPRIHPETIRTYGPKLRLRAT